ncbi:ferritin-like domain-containing protein [Spirosoma sp. KNUC1025]|uniref:ferritin-like domain-containing protein n=1 Tax=Spirosoma sp. KNUC1025 TaxID=2894082 RepID=UPI00386C630A|nr:ferritin-like domain-containing protein [Spirosoma sp. KNUC1025]
MEQLNEVQQTKSTPSIPAIPSVERRMFMRQLGLLSASTAAFLASCTREMSDVTPQGGRSRMSATVLPDGTIDLGSGDIGISNLAYTLEQLEVAYYSTVLENSYGLSQQDRKVIEELHDHEIVHREFFKAFLGSNAIPMLDFDFSGVALSDRNSVFDAAQQFENVGIAAYNGTGPLIDDLEILKIAGKIVSIESRHATLARYMLQPKSYFSLGHELIDPQGRDWALTPPEIVMKAQPFIKQKISIANLPTY